MISRRAIIFCTSVFLLIGWAGLLAHADVGDLPARASSFVNALGSDAIATMADKSLTKAQRVERFRKLFQQGFDIPTIARFALARYWNVATPIQQQEYLTQFKEMVVQSYAAHFDSYGGGSFRILSSRADSEHDVFVVTEVTPFQGPPAKVEWRVRQRGDRLGIIDVVVEGVSMGVSERQEFASVIQAKAGNIDAFIQALRDKNATLTSGIP